MIRSCFRKTVARLLKLLYNRSRRGPFYIKSFNNYIYVSGSDGYFVWVVEENLIPSGAIAECEIFSLCERSLRHAGYSEVCHFGNGMSPPGTNIDYYLASSGMLDVDDLSLSDFNEDFTFVDYFSD